MAAIRYYIKHSAISKEHPLVKQLIVGDIVFQLSRDDALACYYIQVDGFKEVGKVTMWPGMESAVEYMTAHIQLPVDCWRARELGHYTHASCRATVQEGSNMVSFESQNLEDIKALWQALLDGAIRPVRPLYKKEQQGPSYAELAGTVGTLNQELAVVRRQLDMANSNLIHSKAVLDESSRVMEVQRAAIARLEEALLDHRDRAGEIR